MNVAGWEQSFKTWECPRSVVSLAKLIKVSPEKVDLHSYLKYK